MTIEDLVSDLFIEMRLNRQPLPVMLMKLTEETGEVAKAVGKGDIEAIAQELADAAIVTQGIANRLRIDLDAAIRDKAKERLERYRREVAVHVVHLPSLRPVCGTAGEVAHLVNRVEDANCKECAREVRRRVDAFAGGAQ
jgi:NTP pyrophosphatase (non-canonical NTP hydrolase)